MQQAEDYAREEMIYILGSLNIVGLIFGDERWNKKATLKNREKASKLICTQKLVGSTDRPVLHRGNLEIWKKNNGDVGFSPNIE